MKNPFVSIGSALLLSVALVGESVQWDPVLDATGYRLSWGPVGGATNIVNVGTNTISVVNPLTGIAVAKPGVLNLTIPLNVRHQFSVQTVISNASVQVISDPTTVVFYTPRTGPTNVVVVGQ